MRSRHDNLMLVIWRENIHLMLGFLIDTPLRGIARNCAKLRGITRNCTELHGIAWNYAELHGTVRNCAELRGIARNCAELRGTARNCAELRGNKGLAWYAGGKSENGFIWFSSVKSRDIPCPGSIPEIADIFCLNLGKERRINQEFILIFV